MHERTETATISVVIPVFNREALVKRAIHSVIRQTYGVSEIIVVDDGSSDDTAASVDSIGDPRIKVIRIGANKGANVARNIGIDAAKGDYVALLDSDDWWLPDKLERQVKAIMADGRKERAVYYTNLYAVRTRGCFVCNRELYDESAPLCEYLIVSKNAMQSSSLVLPTGFARTIRFDERLTHFQDWDFVIRSANAGAEFIGTMEPLVVYDCAESHTRISSNISLADVRRWLRAARPSLTKKTELVLLFDVVAVSSEKAAVRDVFNLLLDVYASGVPLAYVLKRLTKLLLPRPLVKTLQKNGLVGRLLYKGYVGPPPPVTLEALARDRGQDTLAATTGASRELALCTDRICD